MIERKVKWIYPLANGTVQKEIKGLMLETGLSKDEVTILYNRGIKTKKDIENFLNLSLENLLDAELLKDALKVAKVIVRHINCGNKIVLYSDYDADGWGCVIVALKLLKAVGANIDWFANEREMGYGIKPEGVDKLLELYPDTKLLLTADNGIVGFEGIKHAIDLGLEVCVTDHHEPNPEGLLPECSGVVDPKRLDETYEFKGLCGTAVIWKVCQLVYKELGMNPKKCNSMLDIVAIATIADCVPLLNENRVIVTEGLKLINNDCKFVWKAMKEILMDARFETTVNAKTVGFTFGPAINACSRLMGNINIPVKAFLYKNEESNLPYMRKDIELMRDINNERKTLCDSQTNGVMNIVDKDVYDDVYIIHHPELHEGIVGIIAGRVAEKYNKPCFVLTNSKEHPDVWKGSGRSAGGLNLKDTLDKIQKESISSKNPNGVLVAYGGHEGAAGITVKDENLSEFKTSMLIECEDFFKDVEPIKKVLVDYALEDDKFESELLDRMQALEPFGQDFQVPTYGIRNFKPSEISKFGGDDKDKHVKFTGKKVDFIAWNGQKIWIEDFDSCETDFNVIGEMRYDSFNNKLQLTTMNIEESFSPNK